MMNKLFSYISTTSSVPPESEPLLKKSNFCDSVDSVTVWGMPTADENDINMNLNKNKSADENNKSNSGNWIRRLITKRDKNNGENTRGSDNEVGINIDSNEGINNNQEVEDVLEGNSGSRSGKWDTLKALLQLACLFVVSAVAVYAILTFYLPPLDEDQKQKLHIPKSIEDLQELNKILGEYMDHYYFNVMINYFVVYIFLQTFSVPGSMWLSVLGGALFGLPTALLLVCVCSAIGSSNCYLLSKTFGKSLVRTNFSTKLSNWSTQLRAQSHNLLNYMIVLRLMPFPPNWFANIAAPHLGVPLSTFFVGTFFGVAGPSIIHIQAGLTINNLTSADEFQIFTWANVGALILIGVAVLVPVWIRRRSEKNANMASDENSEMVMGREYEGIMGSGENEGMEFGGREAYGTFVNSNSRSEGSRVS